VLWFLSALLMPAIPLAAQIDIPITAIGPIRDLVRNGNWGAAGQGGLTNNFIFTPVSTSEGVCLYVANQDSVSTHTFNLAMFGTGDQTVKTFAGNQGKWALLGPVSNAPTSTGSISLPASTTKQFFFPVAGQARVTVTIASGTGAPVASATVTIVEAPNGIACGNVTSAPIICPYTVPIGVAGASNGTLIVGTPNETNYLCNLTISFAAAPAAGSISIGFGNGNCTAPSIAFQIATAATTPLVLTFVGQPLIPRFQPGGVDFVGQYLCVINNQATALVASATVAQF
jgi:hypothetical protein